MGSSFDQSMLFPPKFWVSELGLDSAVYIGLSSHVLVSQIAASTECSLEVQFLSGDGKSLVGVISFCTQNYLFCVNVSNLILALKCFIGFNFCIMLHIISCIITVKCLYYNEKIMGFIGINQQWLNLISFDTCMYPCLQITNKYCIHHQCLFRQFKPS